VSHTLGGFFVEPALIAMKSHSEAMMHELFVPILYVLPYKTMEEVWSVWLCGCLFCSFLMQPGD
jgi:acyl-CoA reductase-like NAD-dependent aldehyde dehydrogenase